MCNKGVTEKRDMFFSRIRKKTRVKGTLGGALNGACYCIDWNRDGGEPVGFF